MKTLRAFLAALIISTLVVFLLPSTFIPTLHAQSTFGYTSIGADGVDSSNPSGTKFTAPASGDITAIQLYVDGGGAGDACRVAIYADNAGDVGAQLAASSEVATASTGWFEFAISEPITSGTVYWLMAWGKTGNSPALRSTAPGDVSNQSAYQDGLTYPTWPDPFVQNNHLDKKLSIYAVYTPAGSSSRPRQRWVPPDLWEWWH